MIGNRRIVRGDVYKVRIDHVTGHEMAKDRSAVVVSCDKLNETSPCVTVVMCSTQQSRDLPEHVRLRSTPRLCMALCEHVYVVDKTRLMEYQGHITRQEQTQVDVAIMVGLALDYGGLLDKVNALQKALDDAEIKLAAPAPVPPDYEAKVAQLQEAHAALEAERAETARLRAAKSKPAGEGAASSAELARLNRELLEARTAAVRAESQKDVYQELYENLLNRYGRKARRESA